MRARLLCLLPMVVLGCGLLQFTVERDSSSTVPGAGVLGTLLDALDFTGLDDFDVTIEQQLSDQGVNPGDLRSVTLTVLRLHAEPDLSFLAQMDVYVRGADGTEIVVANGSDFPEGQDTVELEVTGADMTDIVVAGGMSFRAEVRGSAPVDDTDVDIHVEVGVEATAQGACRDRSD